MVSCLLQPCQGILQITNCMSNEKTPFMEETTGKMTKQNAKAFYEQITAMFGEPYVIRKAEPSDGGVPVHVFFFNDLPEKGCLTSVTFGLSESEHPDWKNGKPELILSLDTNDESWGIGTGIFASEFRGEKSFSYGSLFTTDNPISKESDMCGFFTFAPSFLSQQQSILMLPAYKVYLYGMYPIYREEVAVFQELGLDRFWHSKNFDMYDVNRWKIGL